LIEPDENYIDDSFSIDEIISYEHPNEKFDFKKIVNEIYTNK